MKTVIYTILINNYDWLNEITFLKKKYDAICYSNNSKLISKRRYKGWEIKKLSNNFLSRDLNNKKQVSLITRWYKFNPHIHLKEYENSIYVDANLKIKPKIEDFINICKNEKYCLGLINHPYRKSIKEEICHSYWNKKINSNEFRILKRLHRKKNIESHLNSLTLYENNLRFTEHKSKEARMILEKTYKMFEFYPFRDQVIFPIILYENIKLNPKIGQFTSSQNFIQAKVHKVKGFKNIRRYILIKSEKDFFKFLLMPLNIILKLVEIIYDFNFRKMK